MLNLSEVVEILKKDNLFKEIISNEEWRYQLSPSLQNKKIGQITYDSRIMQKNGLFFCKGLNFKEAYLAQAIENGTEFYLSETPYTVPENITGIIVTDIRKAMALISMAFYDYPQEKLKIVAYTGTKGKTSSAYFCYNILNKATNHKTALFSTSETILGGNVRFDSKLTTAESIDLYRMMDEAVKNGMTHLVMEVSSQAYKQERVYSLTYDVGIFLNISPDHISPIEHPTFDDYFYCKRELLKNSKTFILNLDSDYSNFLLEEAEELPLDLLTFSSTNKQASVIFHSMDAHHFEIETGVLNLQGIYTMGVEGEFNQSNGVSALMASSLMLRGEVEGFSESLATTLIPGRMEKVTLDNGTPVYIDFAHNYLSLKSLLAHVEMTYPNKRIRLVMGSTGDKGVSRRLDFGRVINEYAQEVILTSDDPGTENPVDIAKTIQKMLEKNVKSTIIVDRKEAIQHALETTSDGEVIVIAGKGTDKYQIIGTTKRPYEGDKEIVREWLVERGRTNEC